MDSAIVDAAVRTVRKRSSGSIESSFSSSVSGSSCGGRLLLGEDMFYVCPVGILVLGVVRSHLYDALLVGELC
jgi:hypothetical protein